MESVEDFRTLSTINFFITNYFCPNVYVTFEKHMFLTDF